MTCSYPQFLAIRKWISRSVVRFDSVSLWVGLNEAIFSPRSFAVERRADVSPQTHWFARSKG